MLQNALGLINEFHQDDRSINKPPLFKHPNVGKNYDFQPAWDVQYHFCFCQARGCAKNTIADMSWECGPLLLEIIAA